MIRALDIGAAVLLSGFVIAIFGGLCVAAVAWIREDG